MSDENVKPHVSDWVPITNLGDLACLGKLAEELNEAAKIAARMIIQGVDGTDPETGGKNRDALRNELADVQAMMTLAIERFNLDVHRMRHRSASKIAHKGPWLAELDALNAGVLP